jgi:Tol biopolymer transport system component/predicted Ser/Thr protein kinase
MTPVPIGTRLGQYVIEPLLGEGGMGTVYRARDSRLNRPVAIKFLSDHLADDARRRFQREAQMASSLNHPHILTVHDAGEFEGRQYLVTELIDGGTLKDWAHSEKRTWNEIVGLLTGVADGLAAAHQAGILHRDVKPANILVARNGYAKLADFGLAKLEEGRSSEDTRTHLDEPSRPGVVMGTIAYMSPEQASGRAVDARSDIFSFGVVLYELLAGRKPFTGASNLDVLQAIVRSAPEPLGPDVPLPLRMAVEKALEKDPAGRYQSMRDLVVDLRRAGRPETATVTLPVTVGRGARWRPWAMAAGLAASLAGVLWLMSRPEAAPENPLAGATFTRLTDFEGTETSPAISPDGKFVAFVSDRDGIPDIWLIQAGTGSLVNLTKGTAGDVRGPLRAIGFSGDGAEIWIAGIEGRRLRLLPLVGGTPRNFLSETAAEVAWSRDGARVVYHTFEEGDPTFTADGTGTNVRPLLPASPPGEHQHFPAWSPDGRWIYFVRGRPATREMDLWRTPADGGEPERMTHVNRDVAYPAPIDDRTVLYVARDSDGLGPWLWALDQESKVAQRVSVGLEQYTSVAATADGRRLVASVVNSNASLWSVPILSRVAEEQDVQPFALPTARALGPRFGRETLFYLSSRSGADGLWSYRDGQATEVWKGPDGALHTPPAVSADGRWVAIALRSNGRLLLHVIAADGTQLRSLAGDVNVRGAASWSPDGQWIVTAGSDATGEGLFKLPVDGSAAVRLVTGAALDPVWSPDGDLIVYGGAQVFALMPLQGVRPDGTPVDLPSITVRREGERVRFLPDGRGLVYMQGVTLAQDFWLLDLTTMTSRRLTHLDDSAAMRSFDITPDGRRIVFDRLRENSDVVLIDLPPR